MTALGYVLALITSTYWMFPDMLGRDAARCVLAFRERMEKKS